MKWISVKDSIPNTAGKYVIKTIGTGKHKSKHKFEARFNGKTFDISNQVCTEWLLESKPFDTDFNVEVELLKALNEQGSKIPEESFNLIVSVIESISTQPNVLFFDPYGNLQIEWGSLIILIIESFHKDNVKGVLVTDLDACVGELNLTVTSSLSDIINNLLL